MFNETESSMYDVLVKDLGYIPEYAWDYCWIADTISSD